MCVYFVGECVGESMSRCSVKIYVKYMKVYAAQRLYKCKGDAIYEALCINADERIKMLVSTKSHSSICESFGVFISTLPSEPTRPATATDLDPLAIISMAPADGSPWCV